MFGFNLRGMAAAAVIAFVAPVAQAELVLDVGPGGGPLPCGVCGDATGQTVGWQFEVISTISVDGIGVWDAGADGIGPDVMAGLWNAAGTLLASATIGNASTAVASAGAGEWLFETIAAQTLTPGIYQVGAVFFNATPLAQFGTAFTTIPEITYVGPRLSPGGNTGLQNPTAAFGGVDGVFGPTLRVGMTVSEPAGLALAGVGLVSLAAIRRRAKVG